MSNEGPLIPDVISEIETGSKPYQFAPRFVSIPLGVPVHGDPDDFIQALVKITFTYSWRTYSRVKKFSGIKLPDGKWEWMEQPTNGRPFEPIPAAKRFEQEKKSEKR